VLTCIFFSFPSPSLIPFHPTRQRVHPCRVRISLSLRKALSPLDFTQHLFSFSFFGTPLLRSAPTLLAFTIFYSLLPRCTPLSKHFLLCAICPPSLSSTRPFLPARLPDQLPLEGFLLHKVFINHLSFRATRRTASCLDTLPLLSLIKSFSPPDRCPPFARLPL